MKERHIVLVTLLVTLKTTLRRVFINVLALTEDPDTDAVTTSIIFLDLSFLLRFSLLMTDLKSSRTDLFNFASLISSGE